MKKALPQQRRRSHHKTMPNQSLLIEVEVVVVEVEIAVVEAEIVVVEVEIEEEGGVL